MREINFKPALAILTCTMLLLFATFLIITDSEPTFAVASNRPADTSLVSDSGTDIFFSPTLSYYFAAGSTLHPAESAMGSDYNAGACVSAVSLTNQFFSVILDLPEGSRIDYLRLYYYDSSDSGSSASIRQYDGAGNTDTLLTVNSTGNSGYGSAVSPFLGHVVENANGGYVLNWLPSATGNTLRLCGLRVAYRLPAELVYLPLITK